MKLWIVGRYLSHNDELYEGHPIVAWDFEGAFTTKEKAIEACAANENYFIAPAILDERWPEERSEWKGSYYPLGA